MSSCDILSLDEWNNVLKNCLGSKHFDLLDCKTNRLQTTAGFLGEHYTVKLSVRLHESRDDQNVLHFFMKTEPNHSESQREFTDEVNAFQKEVGTLSELFVKFKEILNGKGTNMVWTCECFFTRPGTIVLENLIEQDYKAFTQSDTLQYEHFELTIKALANMHSASIIYEEKQLKPFRNLPDIYPKIFEETFFINKPNSFATRCMDASIKAVLFLVELIHGKEGLEKSKVAVEKLMTSIYDLQKPSEYFRNVTCQGDMKRENILFRHENGKPVEVRIVDFQLTRYAPPANDIMCFLYISSDKNFRDHYMSRLLRVYYDTFAKNVNDHGLVVADILSEEEFKKSCNFYKKLGIALSGIYNPMTYMNGENLTHIFTSSENFKRFCAIDRTPEILDAYNSDAVYRKNVQETIEELLNTSADVIEK